MREGARARRRQRKTERLEEPRVLSARCSNCREMLDVAAAVIFVTIEECNIVTPSDKSCLRIAV